MSVAVRSSGNDVPPSEAAATLWMAAIDRLRKHIASLCDQRSAGQSPSSTAAEKDLIAPLLQEPRFAWLMQTFDLDALDGAILLIAAAGEIDPSIELLLASAASHPRHGGVSSVSCMGLLAIDAAQRVAMRRRFTAEHALFQHRLLLATARSAGDVDPWRRGQLSVDPQVLGMLLYEPGIDPRLARYCRLIEPVAESESTPLSRGQWQRLVTMADHTQATHRALHLQFHGNPGSGRRQTAEALANTLGLKLLVADVAQIAGAPEFAELLAPLFRQAWFSDALLYIEGVQTLSANVELERLLDATSEDSGITVLATPLQ